MVFVQLLWQHRWGYLVSTVYFVQAGTIVGTAAGYLSRQTYAATKLLHDLRSCHLQWGKHYIEPTSNSNCIKNMPRPKEKQT